jgi:hypothetical protein
LKYDNREGGKRTDCPYEKCSVIQIHGEMNILHKIKILTANWIGHILLRNFHLKHFPEGQEKEGYVTGRRRRRCKQLLGNLKERRGYWKFKEEALDRAVWRTRFG